MSTLLQLRMTTAGAGQVADPPDPPTSEAPYPRLGTPRTGPPNWGQTGTLAENDRAAMGLMDVVTLFGFGTSNMDTTPPASNWIARTTASQEIIDANPGGEIYLFYYFNLMETGDVSGPKKTYLDAATGPNGSDGWCRDAAGDKFSFFGGSFGTNISNYVSEDDNNQRYTEWYADNIVEDDLITPHTAAGVQVGGPGGVNVMLDNFQIHSNKSGCDWNQAGGADDTEAFYDPEDAAHVAAGPVAVTAYSGFRENSLKGLKRIEANNTGMIVLPNTNQWSEEHSGALADLRNVLLEYRLSGEELDADVHGGFSEQNSNNITSSWPRSGVGANGLNRGQDGSWQRMYNNVYQSVRFAKEPKLVLFGCGVECLDTSTRGDADLAIWPNVPSSSSAWNMAKWTFATAQIAGAYFTPSGTQIGTQRSGMVQSTPLFDFMGLINTSTTKLYRHWMGDRTDGGAPTTSLVDHSNGAIWVGYWDNCCLVLNSDNDEDHSNYVLDTTLLTGGPYKHFNGVQDAEDNGLDLGSTLSIAPINAHVLVNKAWYDAL